MNTSNDKRGAGHCSCHHTQHDAVNLEYRSSLPPSPNIFHECVFPSFLVNGECILVTRPVARPKAQWLPQAKLKGIRLEYSHL